jgi:glutamine synthetase
VEEIVRSISSAGIKVRQFHTEGESGQYEISTQPLEPLQAEDALIYCQEAIKNVCTQHGLRATMFPKPFEKRGGNGIHHHLSISRTDKEEYFLAGLLEHWGALAAFYMPNFDSNSRLRPNEWVSWGYENKTQAIRKIKEGHWELRGIDATANPHMTMTAILTAGLLGLESEKELTIKDPMKFALMGFDDKEAEDLGFKDKMPTSLKEALSRLKADEALRDALGPEIIDRYLKVKAKEEEIFSKLTRSERVEISMQLF